MSPTGVRFPITGVAIKTRTAAVGLVVLVAVASGCTSALGHGEPTVERACFRVRDTRGFEAMDDRFVDVRCVRDRHYLLTMETACFGLQESIRIAIGNEFDRVCSNHRAMISYRDFNRLKTCGILTVETVASREEGLELVEKRRGSEDPRPLDEPG